MSSGDLRWTEALVYSLLCCWLGLLTAGYNFRRRVGHVIYWGGAAWDEEASWEA